MSNRKQHFNSGREFADWVKLQRTINGPMPSFGYRYSSNQNDPSSDAGLDALTNGNEDNMNKAQDLVDQLALQIDVPKREWAHSVAGYFPDVPRMLAGTPDHMFMLSPTSNDHTPLRVFVGLTSSAMIDHDDLIKRGVALAAFTIAMSNTRPVEIIPYVNLGSGGRRGGRNMLISWRISSSPLVLSELLAITLPEVTRYVGIEAARHLYGQEAAHDPAWHVDAFNELAMREHLGANPDDLYLPSIHASDPILDDPIAWITTQVNKYTQDHQGD